MSKYVYDEDLDVLHFQGLCKIYNADETYIGHAVAMKYYNNGLQYMAFYRCKNGKRLRTKLWLQHGEQEIKKIGNIDTIHSFKDEMDNIYYIGPIYKSFTFEL